MRESLEWEAGAGLERMTELSRTFSVLGTVGDQDWLTLLGWDRPELFYPLPCHYNIKQFSSEILSKL